jgi:MFS family permease
VLLLYGGTVVLCRLVFARLPDRVGPRRLAGTALTVAAVGLFLVGLLGSTAGLLVGTAVMAGGIAFVTPAVFATVFSTVPAEERGSAAATTSVFIDLGLSGGPMLLGLLAAASSIPAAFMLAASVPLLGALMLGQHGNRRLRAAPAR